MHELSIALSVLEVVEEEAERRGVTVSAVRLKLGPLAGVIKDALISAFDLAREGTSLEKCSLVIEEVPIMAFCPQCQTERTIQSPQHISCAICGTPTPQIISVRELEVTAMEIHESVEG
jgi:hydrogenase nickel incorporation protein HypA/HybF